MVDEYEEDYDEFGNFEQSQLLELAQLSLERSENETALELVEEYLEQHPLDVDALNVCAVASANLNDHLKAMTLYRAALSYDPQNGAIHHNFGVLLEKTGDYHAALAAFDRSLELQPDFPEAYINRGNVLDELGQTEEALAMYDEAMRRMPDSSDACFNKGYALNRLERFDEAKVCFLRSLEFNTADAASLNGLGFALAGLKQLSEAIEYYNQAIERDPDNPTYYYNRANSYSRLHQLHQALTDYDTVLTLDSDFGEALVEKIVLLNDNNRSKEAFAALDAADLTFPDSSEVPFYRALLHERRGELEAALDMLDISLARDPESNYSLNNKGNVLMDLNRLEEALVCFDTILQRAPEYTLAHYNRACVFSRQGKEQETLDELEFVLTQDERLLQDALTDPDFAWLINNPFFLKLASLNKA